MMSDQQLWCADTTLRLAIEIAAKETGQQYQDIFRDIVNSPAYDALYDESTGLWGDGPGYLLDYWRRVLTAKTEGNENP